MDKIYKVRRISDGMWLTSGGKFNTKGKRFNRRGDALSSITNAFASHPDRVYTVIFDLEIVEYESVEIGAVKYIDAMTDTVKDRLNPVMVARMRIEHGE